MDEQRFQAYVNLIQKLLACPNGQEGEVIQQHAELVDAKLLIVMQQSAAVLNDREDSQKAKRLLEIAAQLERGLGVAAESESAEQFLLGMLIGMKENNGNSQQVYSVWATKQENLKNPQLLNVLPSVAELLMTRDLEMRMSMATILYDFGNLIQNFPMGNHWLNLELAIIAYQKALQVYTYKASPRDWANTQINLANAYLYRTQGNRTDNLEQAITGYQQALQFYTRKNFPQDWAIAQANLAVAYTDRIQGNRADNLEQAIEFCQQALLVYTYKTFPQEWANTQNNLANAYFFRIQGNLADNLEQSITGYQRILLVYAQKTFPQEWADTQHNLATAYSNRIRGDRADNLEQAIECYQRALQVLTREAFPQRWAMILHNLSAAYSKRIRGDRADNLEQAINACQQALLVRTREASPQEWAMTQNNLANAYSNRIRGDRADNLEQAINACQQALEVYTREASPQEWATTQNNLASAYLFYIRGDRADNLEQAIKCYRQTLPVYTRKAFPYFWALTQHNLATAYSCRILGTRTDNLEQAIGFYQQALQVYTYDAFPNDCRQTAFSLGNVHFEQKAWAKASEIYTLALKAAEALYQSTILLGSKAAELAVTNDLPRRAAYALARNGQLQQAVLTLEQGRARGLSETLERDRANLVQLQRTHPNLATKYQDITAQLHNLEAQERQQMISEDRHSLTPEALRTEAQRLRQTLTETLEQIRQVDGYIDFLAQPNFDDVRQAVGSGVPLIYLVPTSTGSLALIVTPNGIADLWLDDIPEISLQEILTAWFNAYIQSQANRSAWLDAIDQCTHQLWQPLMAPLVAHLKQHSLQQAILIPTGYLSLLPLHAAWTEDDKTPTRRRYAFDDIYFTYAPNARSLNAAQLIADRTSPDSLLAIDEPNHTGASPLPNSAREIQAAIATFRNPNILHHEQATREAILDALPHCNVMHCSCHGNANLQEPLKSGLAMAGEGEEAILTLRNLLDLKLVQEKAGGIRLAILSACETGLAGIELADEAISLPTGLLQAGVAGVVASLWSVSEISTMILLSRFYTLWRDKHLKPSQALIEAQKWLRDSEPRDVVAHCETFIPELASRTGELYRSLRLDFSHPYYWAAFSYTGI